MERLRCEIRSARDDDRSMLVLLAEETLRRLAEGAGHPERYHADEFLALLDRAEVFVAEAGAEPAGFAAVEEDDGALTLRCLCVSPAHEGRGVSHQLVAWAEGMAIDRRLSRLAAHVPAADALSLRLYREHDFISQPESGRPDMVLLEKRLPSVEA